MKKKNCLKLWLAAVLLLCPFRLPALSQNITESPGDEDEEKVEKQSILAPDDSISNSNDVNATELEELVVKGDNAWIENGKAIFIPQKVAKNLSRTMEDLIERMHTGLLTVENGKIQTISGRPVTIYINGVKADNLDASTFWAKNALRVEYMQSSSDPEFAGSNDIVNFVMREYVTGGLTKIMADQNIPNSGDYQVSSKLVWGKMTYQALFKGGYSRDHLSGNEESENFTDVWYKGIHYNNIAREENVENCTRSNDIFGSFSARYTNNDFIATHVVDLQWNEDPGSGTHGISSYSPQIISGNNVLSNTRGHSLSPAVRGTYNYYKDKWGIGALWDFAHSHNDYSSSYQDGGLPAIITDIEENYYKFTVKVAGWYYPLVNKLSFNLSAKQEFNYYDTSYTGSTISRQQQNNSSTDFVFRVWYSPISKLVLSVEPQLSIHRRDVNHLIKTTEKVPGVNGSLWFGINRKSYLSLNSWYAQIVPPVTQRNDLILRQTELKWIEGNPEGKVSDFYKLSLNYGVTPTSWLNSTLMIDYTTHNDQSVIRYRSGGVDYDGVIGRYEKSIRENSYGATWDIKFSLFDHKINLHNQLSYRYDETSMHEKCAYWRTRPGIEWNFGNCSLYAWYSSPQKFFERGGVAIGKLDQQYGLNFSYGNGNLIFDCSLDNIFTKRMNRFTWFESGAYSYISRNWNNGRTVKLSLTYTFDYGKKVSPGIDISTKNIKSTSVLGIE